MNQPAAPLTERPAVDTPLGTPQTQTEAPPDALFAALLTIQTARTAPAEGQTTQTPEAPMTPDATTVAELVAALPVAAPIAAQAAAPTVAAPAPTKPDPPKATPAVPGVPARLAVPAAEAPPADAPTADAPAPDAPAKQPPPAHATQPATPAIPAVPAHVAEKAKDRSVAEPAKAARPIVAETKDAPKDSPKPAAPAPEPEVAAVQPKDRPALAHGTPEPRPVLRGERIEALVRLATRNGAAEARMELHPQELGSVVVKLRMTSDGLQASFTASNPEALSQLQQAGDDLRRSLEAKGVTLATLDVRAEADQAGERRGERRGWGNSRTDRRAEELDDEALTATTSIPAGELVDVHA